MAYNKARAEKNWLKWKNAEEKQLRELGVDEEIIQRLHMYDWEEFKSDRRFYEKLSDMGEYFDLLAEEKSKEITTVEDLLDDIDNERLLLALKTEDRKTLEIVLWKMEGYSSEDISKKCGLSVNAINFRMWHFRKNIKKMMNI